MMPTMRLGTLALLLVCGCGKNPGNDNPIDAPADSAAPPGYTRLIGRTWSLPTGAKDIYRCVRLTIPQDMYITNFMAEAPTGTHHTVLSIASSNTNTAGPDGEYDCTVQSLGMVMLYASGVGTSPLDFPDGVGIKVSAGQQVHLNLHLYNASDNALSGESAIWVKSQPTPPPTLAEMVFAGKIQFSIPAAMPPSNYDVVGGCTSNASYSLFAIWPHMHKLARHQKLELINGAGTSVISDRDYTFSEQKYWLQDPVIQVKSGDQIRVTCSYLNDTGISVPFGDSSDKEMCFTGLYRYPAQGSGLFQCTDVPFF